MKAIWKNVTLAESKNVVEVQGVHFFPPDSLRKEFFEESETHATIRGKGEVRYKHVVVEGELNTDAAWYYPQPAPGKGVVKNYVAFGKDVKVLG